MDSDAQPARSRADADQQQQQQRRAALPPQLLSPAPSRRPSMAATPSTPPAERPGDDCFEPLSRAPSQPSPLSTHSVSRLPSLTTSETRSTRPEQARRPSIRIRRSSVGLNRRPVTGAAGGPASSHAGHDDTRRHQRGHSRSVSQPAPVLPAVYISFARDSTRLPQVALPRLMEEESRPTTGELGITGTPISPTMSLPERTLRNDAPAEWEAGPARRRPNRLGRVSRIFWPGFGKRDPAQTGATAAESRQDDEYDEELVDWLDIIDPEVQTLSTLTNVQNSLFIPDLGGWVNRRPTYVLSQRDAQPTRPASADVQARPPWPQQNQQGGTGPLAQESAQTPPGIWRSNTITSRLTDSHYAALPHGRSLEGWSAADKWDLDDHVRHMLHSRRARFKRTIKGFGQYVRRPLGFFVTLYATLITLFGLAWVLFLIGWIYVGSEQVYAIHIIDSVLVALFAVMGDGLAPFRAIDTYHMFFVVRYTRMIVKAGERPQTRLWGRSMPSEAGKTIAVPAPAPSDQIETLQRDPSSMLDQPAVPTDNRRPRVSADADPEDGRSDSEMSDRHPLTVKQRKSLSHHQAKLAKSHSFYKPEETFTHYSFPLGYLVAIVILLDCHSCLQISLGACTWGINYHVRPFALTTVILCVSITCNLMAGLAITIGDRKTRKKDVVELLNRQELTVDAIRHIEHKKKKEQEKSGEGSDQNTRPKGSEGDADMGAHTVVEWLSFEGRHAD
ncbi:Uncharacterized protein TCAP_05079 [Tolypocladium capitatum]|uniref:Integral membrane protein n=1 Tax=Tolypocladium capitatum TaxID=45235 RepID=A0A2K3QBV6_9HYPO|nr:Uncharacterized protein TCAP_05079 [Tolypocladium capitatum]